MYNFDDDTKEIELDAELIKILEDDEPFDFIDLEYDPE